MITARNSLVGVFALLLMTSAAGAEIKTEEVTYKVDGQNFTGYLAYDDSNTDKRPGVLVVHEWWGLNDYPRKRAEMLAELGYTGFALDMYGSGKVAEHPDDAKTFMQAVRSDMDAAEQRFNAAKEVLAAHATVDPDRIAAIGYCFGGGVVLHMARVGADLDGVVSYHGMLATETPAKPGAVKARILVFTGGEDPFVPNEQVQAFKDEMEAAGADTRVVVYPKARHGFTNPAADAAGQKYDMPLAYDEDADENSWRLTKGFFQDIFPEVR